MTTKTEEQVQMIDMGLLVESPLNPRRDFGNGELLESIRTLGVLVALVVRPKGKKFEVLDGARRFRNAKKAGLEKVPCFVRDIQDAQIPEFMFNVNEHKSLRPCEQGRAFTMMVTAGATIQDLAKRTNRKPEEVSMLISLLDLEEPTQELIDNGYLDRDIYSQLVKARCTKFGELMQEKIRERFDYASKDIDDDETYVEPMRRDAWRSIFDEQIRKSLGPSLDMSKVGKQKQQNFGPEWMKHFDNKDCAKCKKPVHFGSKDYGDTLCLDMDCWRPKARDAKRIVKEQKTFLKQGKSEKNVIQVDRMSNRQYRVLQGTRFDPKCCGKCSARKTGHSSYNGTQKICVDVPCFDHMHKAAEKIIGERLTAFRKDIEAKLKEYLAKYKPVGMDENFIAALLSETNLKTRKGAKPDVIEKDIVRQVVTDATLDKLRYNVDEDDIKQLKTFSFLKGVEIDIRVPAIKPIHEDGKESEGEESKDDE